MDRIEKIYKNLAEFFHANGFREAIISGEKNYIKGNLYCVPICLEKIGFLIDYAHSLEEAQKNMHYDGAAVPLSETDEVIVAELKAEILAEMKEAGLSV